MLFLVLKKDYLPFIRTFRYIKFVYDRETRYIYICKLVITDKDFLHANEIKLRGLLNKTIYTHTFSIIVKSIESNK